MVESVAYFEAYRHVLKRLQEVITSHEIEAMPFKQYIVECSFEDIPLPLYTRYQPGQGRFNLQGVISFKRGYRFSTSIDLADLSTWPAAESTDLDDSQMEAIKAAMTQDLSVIQGPPGTGKTYIGLKIVQGLLANRQVWDPHKKSPILVVCYTNHALDQFLEGIRQHLVDGKPPNMTRIGGRCKSDILADCTLFEKVNRAREDRSIPRAIHKEFGSARAEMMGLKKKIENLMDKIQAASVKLFSVDVLSKYILRHHLQQIYGYHTTKPIEAWLGLQFSTPREATSLPDWSPQMPEDNPDLIYSDDDSDNEVQIILNHRLERREKVYRPQQGASISPFDLTELEEAVDPEGWKTVQMDSKKRKNLIRKQLSRGLEPLKPENVPNINTLGPQQKWMLYIHWRDRHVESLLQTVQGLSTDYERACNDFCERKQERDDYVVAGCDVVGMTTTGAAKYNHIIKAIKPKIVVFEEAAEIFEPHIFTSISGSVQQLILIGDHQQLRPKPTCYELETKYNFNVSLFERLAMNGCPVQTLSIQHRMRPEIASLITPAIYKELYNDSSVERYDSIKGVGKNLFFIHHNFAEMSEDVDRKSHSNPHEAKFLTALCDYLIKQGYDPSEITMLTLYSGQVIEIKKQLKRRNITGVRTVVVDDFQGEENEIILLSLVRSNSEKKIGFVGIENRVCVALSRAKKGMFISGNALMLTDEKTVWPQILTKLKTMESVGKSLALQCQIHKDQAIEVNRAEDFSKCPEGGCQKPCNTRLDCGHACKRLCHPCDREHKKYKCAEKTLKKLPGCGHFERVSCSADIKKVKCLSTCNKTLYCGHQCAEKCSNPCTTKCKHPVDKKLACGHTVSADCHLKPEDVVCSVPCMSLLECEHECGGTCGTCQRGRLHTQCKVKCGRTLICEHICKFPCTPTCPPCTEPCKNFCVHSKCPKMCFEPCQPCLEPCKWVCKHKKCTKQCGEPCNREPCNVPCTKLIRTCRHPCIGLCGEPCPTQCRICDKDDVTEVFFGEEDEEDARFVLLPDCGHIFEYKGLDHWMEIKKEDDQSHQISFKECPRCKTPVKKCLRYSNAIKQYLKDVEKIKQKQASTLKSADLKPELATVKQSLDATNRDVVSEDLAQLERVIEIDSKPGRKKLLMFPHVVKAKLTLLSQIAEVTKLQHKVSRELIRLRGPLENTISSRIRKVKRCLNRVQEFIRDDYLFEQQLSDAEAEMCRLTLLARISEVQQKVLSKGVALRFLDDSSLKTHAASLLTSGWKTEKVSKKKEDQIVRLLKTLGDKYGLDGLTDTERKEIAKIIGLPKGHWFKCPNGHFYCIADCGGAMVVSKCPECNVEIGGSHHQLLATNQLASEMDGARYAAWSEMANLENFDPQDLQFD